MLTHRRVREQRRHHLPAADVNAAENLRYIRETMEQSARFTDVPGWGMALIGVTAVVAASFGAAQASETAWLRVWVAEAIVALLIALLSIIHKTTVTGIPLRSGPTKKFCLGLLPPLLAGGLLTVLLQREGLASALPGTWLLLYGAAVVASGAYAIRIVPVLGACFMAAGAIALFGPAAGEIPFLGSGLAGCTLHLASLSRGVMAAEPRTRGRARRPAGHAVEAPAARVEVESPPPARSQDLDAVIHERTRLGIVGALAASERLSFVELKNILRTTDGNLSAHTRKLEDVGYINATKRFEGRLPRTEYELTEAGRGALERYLDQMDRIVKSMRNIR